MFIILPRVFASNHKRRFVLFCSFRILHALQVPFGCDKNYKNLGFSDLKSKISIEKWIQAYVLKTLTQRTCPWSFRPFLCIVFKWMAPETQKYTFWVKSKFSFLVYFSVLATLQMDIFRFKGSEYGFMVRAYVFTLRAKTD